MEPTYEYIKGQGWVLNNKQSKVLTFKDGVKALVENRKPNRGEKYTYVTIYDKEWVLLEGEYQMNLNYLEKHWAKYTTYDGIGLYDGRHGDEVTDIIWVTITKV